MAHGGKRPVGAEFEKGYWFEPTILTDVTQDMTIVHEESFGPILPVLKFSSFEQVIGYANDCEYGLAAMVFTNDMSTIMKCNDELDFLYGYYVGKIEEGSLHYLLKATRASAGGYVDTFEIRGIIEENKIELQNTIKTALD